MESGIGSRIKVKYWSRVRIRIKVMRIRYPDGLCSERFNSDRFCLCTKYQGKNSFSSEYTVRIAVTKFVQLIRRVLTEIKRSPLSLVLQTPSKSFRHYSLLITKGGVRGDVGVKSIPRICKSSYGEKLLSYIFISIYVNLIGFRTNIYE